MSDEKAVILKADAPVEWGNRAEIGALAERFATMLPNAKDMTRDELLTAAQYCRMMDLNPFRGEVYFYKSKGKLAVVDGYKALARWAREKSPYSEWIELLPLEAGQIAHVRVWILRDDRKAMLHEFMGMGATFSEAREMAAHYADGVVTEGDLRAKDGVKDPPVGWTWEQVARKRAFKNAINLSHGAPSPREIARMSWEVNGTHTRPEDWDGAEELSGLEAEKLAELRAQGRENMERIAALSPEELQAKAEANGRILYGDPAFEGFDTPTVTAPPAFEEEPDTYSEIDATLAAKAGARPYDAETVRAKVHEGAGWEGGARLLDGEPVTDGQKKALGGLMGKVAAKDGMTQAEIDKSRHDILGYLLGVRSINDLYKREGSALIHWLKAEAEGSWELNEFAAQEAAAILAALAVEQGQLAMPL